MPHFLILTRTANDWQALLASLETRWSDGHSAQSAALSWAICPHP